MVEDGRTVSFPSDGTAGPGDAVSLDANGQVTPTDADNSIGVLSDQAPAAHDAGDNVPVHVTGVVVANVAAGAVAGDSLTEVDTSVAGAPAAGTLIVGGDGQMDAFSDEGGQYKQHDTSSASLDAGYAAVHLG